MRRQTSVGPPDFNRTALTESLTLARFTIAIAVSWLDADRLGEYPIASLR